MRRSGNHYAVWFWIFWITVVFVGFLLIVIALEPAQIGLDIDPEWESIEPPVPCARCWRPRADTGAGRVCDFSQCNGAAEEIAP